MGQPRIEKIQIDLLPRILPGTAYTGWLPTPDANYYIKNNIRPWDTTTELLEKSHGHSHGALGGSNYYTYTWLGTTKNRWYRVFQAGGSTFPRSGEYIVSIDFHSPGGTSGTSTVRFLVNGVVVATSIDTTKTESSWETLSTTIFIPVNGVLLVQGKITIEVKPVYVKGMVISSNYGPDGETDANPNNNDI